MNLPSGWTQTSIGTLLREPLSNGRSVKTEEGGFPVLRLTCLKGDRVDLTESKGGAWSAEDAAPFCVEAGDVLVARGNGSLRLVGRAGLVASKSRRVAYPDTLIRIRPDLRALDPGYLTTILNSRVVRPQVESVARTTAGIYKINQRDIESITLRVPPLPEQRRIVEALETHFTRLDAAVATLERVRANLKRYRAAVLQAAVEGRLGIEPSARGEFPAGWRVQTLDELSDPDRSTTYGVIKLGEEVPHGVPTLRTSNVRPLRLDVDGVKRIDPRLSNEYRRTVLRGGEILIAVRGTLGGVVVAPASCAGWNVSREVAVVALRNPELAPVVALFLASPKIQSWLSARTRGIAYTGINIATLKETPIPIPPKDERNRIVEATERALSLGAAAEAQVAGSEARIARFRQSLLHLAFSGRLVPQDPDDEPASVLLERIRTERAAAAPKKKPARNRR